MAVVPLTLTLIRHAAASGSGPDGSDHGRALSAAGEAEVAALFPELAARIGPPERILSSDATRALATANAFARAMGRPVGSVTPLASLYLARPDAIRAALGDLAERAVRVALVGHNPGLSQFAAWLTGDGTVSLPTLGVVHGEVDAPGWDALTPGAGRTAWRAAPGEIRA